MDDFIFVINYSNSKNLSVAKFLNRSNIVVSCTKFFYGYFRVIFTAERCSTITMNKKVEEKLF